VIWSGQADKYENFLNPKNKNAHVSNEGYAKSSITRMLNEIFKLIEHDSCCMNFRFVYKLFFGQCPPTYRSRQIYTRNTFDFQTHFFRVLDFLAKYREGDLIKFNLFHHQKFSLIKSLI